MSYNGDAIVDAVIQEAARCLARGDPLGALKRVSLRDDAEALALRGVALAQIGDLARARPLLTRAAEAFESKNPIEHARCVAAIAEIDLATRALDLSLEPLVRAIATLGSRGDPINAAYAELVYIRARVLLGDIDEAHDRLRSGIEVAPDALIAVHHLIATEVAIRRIEAAAAHEHAARAKEAALAAGIESLVAEIEATAALLTKPAARVLARGEERDVDLFQVEALLASDGIVVDVCRSALRANETVSFLRRGTLFRLLVALARGGDTGATREELFERLFEAKVTDDSHRARLRVDVSRLRKSVAGHAEIEATEYGFRLVADRPVTILLPPIDGEHASVLALLADGERWSTAALTAALGSSRRTVQRALARLADEGRVVSSGRGPRQRWQSPPLTSIATAMLLPRLGPTT